MEISTEAFVKRLEDCIEVQAGPHRLELPLEAGDFYPGDKISNCWYEGVYLLISRPEGSLVAFDQSGNRLWKIPPQEVTPLWKSGFVGVNAFERGGEKFISFADPIGHFYHITDLRTGRFIYKGHTK